MIESADEFVRLRTSSAPEQYRRAAHDEAPLQVWVDVIERFPEMRSWVAHNKTVPLVVLELLATDDDPSVRCAVADKRKLTPDLFRTLATDHDVAVRARVAYNRKVPIDVLRSLAADQTPLVRDAARASLEHRSQ